MSDRLTRQGVRNLDGPRNGKRKVCKRGNPCPDCDGTGWQEDRLYGDWIRTCPRCGGTGLLTVWLEIVQENAMSR
jgi:DnaJ-class molecular chaperone